MRICSLLPSGTEILYALGLDDEIVGVSHECDLPAPRLSSSGPARQAGYPPAVTKPRVMRTIIDQERMTSAEIDDAVRSALATDRPLFEIDEQALRDANPDLIVTQELCEVCAIDAAQVSDVVRILPKRPKMVSLHPHTLAQMLEEIRLVGQLTDRKEEAERLVGKLTERIERVKQLVAGRSRPRVFCLEWLKPPMASGHWVPEQVEIAGGSEVLGRTGQPSRYVTWEEIATAKPEVLLLMPCGFPIGRTRRELPVIEQEPAWHTLPAVRNRQVYLVNGPACFNRSGPRLVDGIELLAGLLHPEVCEGLMPCDGVEKLGA